MYKIAVVDDDEHWCFAVQSALKKSFEVTTFAQIPHSLPELVDYDLVIIDYSIFPNKQSRRNVHDLEVIRFLKINFVNPPLLVITTKSLDVNNNESLKKLYPEADTFYAKDTGLEKLLEQTQQLLATKKQKLFERSSPVIYGVKPMATMAVVDDDKHWCYTIERFFRNEFEVYTFPTPSAFLQQSFDFDLVLVDYSIPQFNQENYMDSHELIRHLKSLRYSPLVFLVSGYVSKNDSSLGKKICPEADAFFAKDAGLDELLHQIKDLLACKK